MSFLLQSLNIRKRSESESMGDTRRVIKPLQQQVRRYGSGRIRHGSSEESSKVVSAPIPVKSNRNRSQSFTDNAVA